MRLALAVVCGVAAEAPATPPTQLIIFKASRTGSTWLTATLNRLPQVSVAEVPMKPNLVTQPWAAEEIALMRQRYAAMLVMVSILLHASGAAPVAPKLPLKVA